MALVKLVVILWLKYSLIRQGIMELNQTPKFGDSSSMVTVIIASMLQALHFYISFIGLGLKDLNLGLKSKNLQASLQPTTLDLWRS